MRAVAFVLGLLLGVCTPVQASKQAVAYQPYVTENWLISLHGYWPNRPMKSQGDLRYHQRQVARLQAPVEEQLQQWGVRYRSFWLAPVIQATLTAHQAHRLRQMPQVAAVERDRPHAMRWAKPRDDRRVLPKGTVQANLSQIGADQLWLAGITGSGVTVGIQDTGMQWDHDLLKNQYRGWDSTSGTVSHDHAWHDAIHVANGSCSADSPAPCDDHGHGTHVTGTVAGDDPLSGTRTGVAPDAKWIGCRNMNQGAGTASSYIECFQWFLAPTRIDGTDPRPDLAPAIISNSWACPPSEGCAWNALQATVDSVQSAGILVVSAAGNSGSTCNTISHPPAIYDSSFTVAAVDGSNQVAGFSSRGVVTVDGSNRLKPNVAAPGVNVRSSLLNGNTGLSSGTSMATPHVAGLAALLLQANPALLGQPAALRRVIRYYATPAFSSQNCGGVAGSQRPNAVYGWGIIDSWNAYQHVLEPVFTDGYEN